MLTYAEKEVRDFFEKIKEIHRNIRPSLEMAASMDNPLTRKSQLQINFQLVDLRVEQAYNRLEMARAVRLRDERRKPPHRRNIRSQPCNWGGKNRLAIFYKYQNNII